MFTSIKTLILLLGLTLSLDSIAHFEFSPITMSLTTSGKGMHSIATVTNKENVQVPIIIRVTERKLLENGEEDRPDTNDIAVYPSQFILEPKESKSIKITWQGSDKLDWEKAYRVIVEEVPVEFSAKSSNRGAVRILINYIGSVYVNSDKVEGDLVLDKINVEEGKFLAITFLNKGKEHVIIKSPHVELIAKGSGNQADKKIILDKNVLSALEGKNVLAQSKLKVRINRPTELGGYENFDWKFTFDK